MASEGEHLEVRAQGLPAEHAMIRGIQSKTRPATTGDIHSHFEVVTDELNGQQRAGTNMEESGVAAESRGAGIDPIDPARQLQPRPERSMGLQDGFRMGGELQSSQPPATAVGGASGSPCSRDSAALF